MRGTTSRFTFSTAEEDDPVFSPDGANILFSLEGDLAIRPANGVGEPRYLYRSTSDKVPTDWSSDGKFIVFGDFGGKSARDIWVMPAVGDAKPIPFATSEFSEQGGAFSPDGKWIAYSSNESGRNEVYVQNFPASSGKWQISTQGGLLARWNRNGKELFYIEPTGQVMSVPIVTSASSLQAGTPLALFRSRLLAVGGPGHRYDVSPDGLRFVINDIEDGVLHAEPLNLVVNWDAEIKKP